MKISVVGGGNAGCFTALHLGWWSRSSDIEIELVHNPEIKPEPVGQASLIEQPQLLFAATGFNWYNNPIHATFKSGILYEGFGKVNEKWFHPFPAHSMAMHYSPYELQQYILKSELFTTVESDVLDIDNIDADYIFDCRGKPDDYSNYEELINPTNACILGKPQWDTSQAYWSRHVATPDGWTFIIPAKEDSPSHSGAVGYCYNSNITKKEVAEYNFLDMFDVEITNHIKFKNYIAKDLVINNRVFLNGNRLFFLEPLESSAIQAYITAVRHAWTNIVDKGTTIQQYSKAVSDYIHRLERFILWHYQFGSKYDTPYWEYAKSIDIEHDDELLRCINDCGEKSYYDCIEQKYGGLVKNNYSYAQWSFLSIKNWYDGMNDKCDK